MIRRAVRTAALITSVSTVGVACAAGGNAAVWSLDPDQKLTRSSKSFTALVTRVGCNDGVTGDVLAPTVTATDSEITVTFKVAAAAPGLHTCPGNDFVPYEVDLGEPLGARALIDGQCVAGQGARDTAQCRKDDGSQSEP